jgi:hypothetical protein
MEIFLPLSRTQLKASYLADRAVVVLIFEETVTILIYGIAFVSRPIIK